MNTQSSNDLVNRALRALRPYQNRRMLNFITDQPVISISFDDFPKTAISEGAKALETRNLRGTYYTCASFAGVTNHHGLQYDAADLPALEASGHEIAGHTYSHVDCSANTPDTILAEVDKNRSALMAMGLKNPITGFAYPYGETRAHLKPILAQRYNAIRGIKSGVHYKRADLNELRSAGLYSDTFEQVMSQIQSLKTRPGWLTLFTHDIQDNPTPWGCTPRQFNAVLDAAVHIGAIILPVKDAVAYLETNHA